MIMAGGTSNFGGGSGDQILFQGGTDNGNVGGLSFVVDNGTTVSTPGTILTAKQLAAFFDDPRVIPNIGAVAADVAGTCTSRRRARRAASSCTTPTAASRRSSATRSTPPSTR